MYQVGDRVVYGIHGVCRVMDLEERMVDNTRRVYLVLEPEVQGDCRYWVPTHNTVAMAKLRPMLSRKELETLIDSGQVRSDEWIPDENQRKQIYRELITSGDLARLMQMLFTLYRRKEIYKSSGKKLHLCDENFLRDAEKVIAGEVMAVYDMGLQEATRYLKEKFKEDVS